MTKVYFLGAKEEKEILTRIGTLFEKAFPSLPNPGDKVAIKVHFGESGNISFVKPKFYKEIIEKIKAAGAEPFLTDTNALYKGSRHNSVDHLKTATEHGFAELGIPIKIADSGYVDVEINKSFFKKVRIEKVIHDADSIVFLNHFKGHMGSGFAAAIKNMSMGCASRAGKQQMHTSTKPRVNSKKCINCKKCGKVCPENCISYDNGYAQIDIVKCVGCDECVVECPTGAIAMMFSTGPADLQKKMAEYALGAVKGKKAYYVNFLINITHYCDCFNTKMKPVIENIGVVAGLDPVAVDQASFDLAKERAGKDIFLELHGFDSTVQLEYAEQIGLGSRKYELIRI